ncbi:hypothetical protein EWM62_10710 [Mucilaginibacter terrigena]|uniref:Uncharacterized protein n=1 Tax=Mucilaginibacter terrigena TaxID=2492395 RepID=A0A4Q5LKD4_9SPHI|nr:hypothetical protein [Mucilaginibacter terrigena]RYU90007.1 hypothetical protein EWM62_10710 [Mucilaginibacter terrigena]
MRRSLLPYFIALLLPLLASAQNEAPVNEDFAKGIKATNTFAFNDHLNVMQVSTDDENFDLIAIDDKMQIVWKTSLAGYGIKTDKLKGKIIALASSDHSMFKGTNNTFKAYVVDPATGKVLADKVVYKSTDEYVEFPQMYTGDGEFFKLAVRQSGFKRKIHVGVPIFSFFAYNGYVKEYNETKNLQVIEYNDKLDSVSSFKPAKSNGIFISLAWNKHADMFIGWLNGPSIEVYKYDAGKTVPSNQLTVPVSLKEDKAVIPSKSLLLQPAEDKNILYYSLLYRNPDKDTELGIGKLDFETNKKSYVTQVIDKANLKVIKKAFVPVNKDIDDVDLGYGGGMGLKYMNEVDGKVILTVASNATVSSGVSSGGVYYLEYAPIINVFDKDLNLKFQQVLPSNSYYPSRPLQTGYHVIKNKLYMVANTKKGLTKNLGVFGILDINTGKWDKMELLSKKHISNSDYSEGPSILWFGNSFIVPYFAPKTFAFTKSNVSLQLNQY